MTRFVKFYFSMIKIYKRIGLLSVLLSEREGGGETDKQAGRQTGVQGGSQADR